MSAMNKTTLLFIRKSMEQCGELPGFAGAVLASPDGLVLAASGRFNADEAAACAAGLVVQTGNSLGQLTAAGPSEILVWGGDGLLWNVIVLSGNYLLMLSAGGEATPDGLRRFIQPMAERLNQALRILV